MSTPTAMAYPLPPRRASGLLRYIAISAILVLAVVYMRRGPMADLQSDYIKSMPSMPSWSSLGQTVLKTSSAHPIDELIANAEAEFENVLKKESHTLAEAAEAYRARRGRHPPPGFDKWFDFAQQNGAVIVEDFFDQIYHDLGPFWGLPASTIRREAWDFEMTINIRDGKATAASDWFWTQIWLNLTQTIEHLLPDMDIALNAMDEPRLVAPWEVVNEYMETEQKSRSMPDPSKVIQTFSKLPPPKEGDPDVVVREKNWERPKSYWEVATRGCPPDSPARKAQIVTDFTQTPVISMALASPHLHRGYVENYTLSTDFCHQPDLQALHGAFIEPLTVVASKTLFPMFGGSKLPTNNEILLPAPMYWNNEERFSGGDDHGVPWAEKDSKAIWRGVATGGKNRANNWKGFQRHRFVAMINATQAGLAERWEQLPVNWALPTSQYDVAAQQEGHLEDWIESWSDAGFIDLNCEEPEAGGACWYTNPYYEVTPGMKMSAQFNNKYLPDIDGNSFSGRYRGFLMSTSLPIKSTIFREWHDSRLFPWKHFVPMDNRFLDFYGIMQYFVGYTSPTGVVIEGHDAAAHKLAVDGQEWANKVLRREDMQIYVLRLLLEYARVSDNNRENMGFVQDLA